MTNTLRTAASALVAAIALSVTLVAAAPIPAPAHTIPASHAIVYRGIALRPCAQEDSNNCYWDAATRGNHQGRSFVTIKGVTYYLSK